MRETCTSGTVRGEDGNILTYSAAFSVRGRHDQVAASSILWADRSIEVGEFANELGRNFRP
jgi:hypothetical protein